MNINIDLSAFKEPIIALYSDVWAQFLFAACMAVLLGALLHLVICIVYSFKYPYISRPLSKRVEVSNLLIAAQRIAAENGMVVILKGHISDYVQVKLAVKGPFRRFSSSRLDNLVAPALLVDPQSLRATALLVDDGAYSALGVSRLKKNLLIKLANACSLAVVYPFANDPNGSLKPKPRRVKQSFESHPPLTGINDRPVNNKPILTSDTLSSLDELPPIDDALLQVESIVEPISMPSPPVKAGFLSSMVSKAGSIKMPARPAKIQREPRIAPMSKNIAGIIAVSAEAQMRAIAKNFDTDVAVDKVFKNKYKADDMLMSEIRASQTEHDPASYKRTAYVPQQTAFSASYDDQELAAQSDSAAEE